MNHIHARIDEPGHVGHVLAALYNGSKPQGMGFLHFDPTPMTFGQGVALIEGGSTEFDYLKGRVMKLSLKAAPVFYPDGSRWAQFDPSGYDRDIGEGGALAALRAAGIEGLSVPAMPERRPG